MGPPVHRPYSDTCLGVTGNDSTPVSRLWSNWEVLLVGSFSQLVAFGVALFNVDESERQKESVGQQGVKNGKPLLPESHVNDSPKEHCCRCQYLSVSETIHHSSNLSTTIGRDPDLDHSPYRSVLNLAPGRYRFRLGREVCRLSFTAGSGVTGRVGKRLIC